MGLIEMMLKTYNGDHWSREKISTTQKKRLDALLKYARERSPFYKELYADMGDDYSSTDIPAVSKSELMARFDDVLTDQNITMERIDAFTQDLDNIGRMIDGKYLIFKTSGSTGNPAVVLYDKRNIDVSSAIAAFRTFRRFQLVQRASDRVELRMISDEWENAFEQAKHDLQQFFESKGLTVAIILSDDPPQANKISGKFKHIYKEFE